MKPVKQHWKEKENDQILLNLKSQSNKRRNKRRYRIRFLSIEIK